MARKVFISVLGASLYEKCKYTVNGFCSSETRYIQQATLEYLNAQNWLQESKAYFLLTEKARGANWIVDNNQRFDRIQKKCVQYTGLRDVLESVNFPFHVEGVSIPDGKDEDEMWQIFETAFKLLEDEDELYFDLTHSFLGNYAKFLKKATVCSITYGNYEARNQMTNEAPIVDLLPLSSLQDWTFATADFLKNGYADRLVELSDKGLAPLMRNDETRTDDTIKLKGFVNHLKSFSLDLQTCRGLSIIEASSIKKIKLDIDSLQKVVIPQLGPVLQQVRDSVEPFDDDGNVINAIKAAQWCYDNQQYQQATTFLEEGIISYFCQRYGIALDAREKRELIPSAFIIKLKDLSEDYWKVKEEWKNLLAQIVDDELMENENLVKVFNSLVGLRNDYNHCGMRDNQSEPGKIRKSIKSCLDTVIPLLTQSKNKTEEMKSYLINLSNHPSRHWSEEQLKAAKEYGELMDLGFPDINPNASEEEITELSNNYVKEIMSYEKDGKITVHIMGELTFCFMVIRQLKENGIECIASTTERNTEEMDDGRKISDFQFIRFRKY